MIQRIQSVLLAIAAMLSVGDVFFPAWKYTYNGETEIVSGMSITSAADAHVRHFDFFGRLGLYSGQYAHIIWFALSLIISLFLLATIFFFKNRLLQIRLCQVGAILIIAQIAAQMYLTLHGPYMSLGGGNATSTPQIGFVLPIASLILTVIASKRIMADEKLVRSVDRLRD